MGTKEFYNLEEIQKYYDLKSNTYVFKENGSYIDLIVFNFNLNIESNIKALDIKSLNISTWDIIACDIYSYDINAHNIDAGDINAHDIYANNITAHDIYSNYITADDINYYAVCFAYKDIICKSINGRRENANHFVLAGKIDVIDDEINELCSGIKMNE